jgi:hypothetical protein
MGRRGYDAVWGENARKLSHEVAGVLPRHCVHDFGRVFCKRCGISRAEAKRLDAYLEDKAKRAKALEEAAAKIAGEAQYKEAWRKLAPWGFWGDSDVVDDIKKMKQANKLLMEEADWLYLRSGLEAAALKKFGGCLCDTCRKDRVKWVEKQLDEAQAEARRAYGNCGCPACKKARWKRVQGCISERLHEGDNVASSEKDAGDKAWQACIDAIDLAYSPERLYLEAVGVDLMRILDQLRGINGMRLGRDEMTLLETATSMLTELLRHITPESR